MKPLDYSPEKVASASCLLAFPDTDDSIFYQVAYAMGQDVPVVAIVNDGDDLARFEPKPASLVRYSQESPNSWSAARPEVVQALREALGAPALQKHSKPSGEASEGINLHLAPRGLTSVKQAEALFQRFVADGLSQELVRELMTEAGARQSWLDFRLHQHFGGW